MRNHGRGPDDQHWQHAARYSVTLPVNGLHLSDDADHRSGRETVKLQEKLSDVGAVFQIKVKLHNSHETWKKKKKPLKRNK